MYKFRKDIIVMIGCYLSIVGLFLPFASVVGVSFRYLVSFAGIINLFLLISTVYYFKNKNRTISLINFFLLSLLFIRIIFLTLINGYEFRMGIYLYISGYIITLYGYRKLILRFIKKIVFLF